MDSPTQRCPFCDMPKCRRCHKQSGSFAFAAGSLTTSYTDHFPARQQGMAAVPHELPGKQYVDSVAVFDDHTTQRADFSPKSGSYRLRVPQDHAMPRSSLDDTTTTRSFHDIKVGKPSTPSRTKADLFSPPETAPFDGHTTSRDELQDWHGRPATCMSPKARLLSLPFEATTSYSADYPPRSPVACPSSPKARLVGSCTRGNSTTYSVDYEPKSPTKPVHRAVVLRSSAAHA